VALGKSFGLWDLSPDWQFLKMVRASYFVPDCLF
jgi:hypothetical protein